MTVIERIQDELERLTQEQIDQAAGRFQPVKDGETVVGEVRSDHARRLWTLAHDYDRREELASHAARFDAKNAEERRELLGSAVAAGAMENVVRGLAWIEIRSELRDDSLWGTGCIGIREGWVLSSFKEPEEETIAIPIPAHLQEMVADMMERLKRRRDPEKPSTTQ